MTNEEIQAILVSAIREGKAGDQTVLRLGRYIEVRIFLPPGMPEDKNEAIRQMGIGLTLNATFHVMQQDPDTMIHISRIHDDGEDYDDEDIPAGRIQQNIKEIVAAGAVKPAP